MRFILSDWQQEYLDNILSDDRLEQLIRSNPWYAQFIPGVRYDIEHKRALSEKQMFQIEKLAHMLDIEWRITYPPRQRITMDDLPRKYF